MNYYEYLRMRRFGTAAAVVAADSAEETAGKVDMEAHDRRHHPDGFDPKHDTCKFREELAKTDKADVLSPNEGNGVPKWDAKDRADAEETAKVLKRVLGGVEVLFADGAYEGGGDTRKAISGISQEEDDEYLDAVENHDIDYAQEMIDDAAKKWGALLDKEGNPIRLYHGSDRGGIDTASNEINAFCTTSKNTAKVFARGRADASINEFYGRMENPLIIDAGGANWDGVKVPKELESLFDEKYALTDELADAARKSGYDGVIIKNVMEGSLEITDDYIFLKADGNLKSADPVTYDYYYGATIPLSERFNSNRSETRYFKDAKGKVVGEYDRATGKITLYPGAKVKDVVHEYAHGLWQFAEQEAKDGRGALLGKMREVAFSAPQAVKDAVRANYGSEGADVMLEECFTHELARRSDTAFAKAIETTEGKPWYRRAWKTIKGVWKGFADKAGLNKADTKGIEDMSPADAAEHILSQLANGRRFGDVRHDGGGDGRRKAIIGKQGAAALGIGRHEEAEKMERDGASREDIWRKTGWWKGKDGKWRVEVPDVKLPFETLPSVAESKKAHRLLMQNLDMYNVNTLRELEQKAPEAYSQYSEMKRKIEDMEKREAEDQFTVRDFVKGTGLDKAYPDLMKIPVRFKLQGSDFKLRQNTNGYFDGEKMVINRLTEPEQIRSHIAHELQHAIQDSEGFAKGANGNFGDFSEYVRSAGEVESRNVQKRLGMTPEERAETPPWETEDVPEDEQIVKN